MLVPGGSAFRHFPPHPEPPHAPRPRVVQGWCRNRAGGGRPAISTSERSGLRCEARHRRAACRALTLPGIDATILALAAVAETARLPATRRGTAPVRQRRRRPEYAILTLHGIDAAVQAFAVIAKAMRVPATCRGTAPVRQPRRRPEPAILTFHEVESPIFGFAAIAPTKRLPTIRRGTAAARGSAGARRAPPSRFMRSVPRFSDLMPSRRPGTPRQPGAARSLPEGQCRRRHAPSSRFMGLGPRFSDLRASPSAGGIPTTRPRTVAARSSTGTRYAPPSRFMALVPQFSGSDAIAPARGIPTTRRGTAAARSSAGTWHAPSSRFMALMSRFSLRRPGPGWASAGHPPRHSARPPAAPAPGAPRSSPQRRRPVACCYREPCLGFPFRWPEAAARRVKGGLEGGLGRRLQWVASSILAR